MVIVRGTNLEKTLSKSGKVTRSPFRKERSWGCIPVLGEKWAGSEMSSPSFEWFNIPPFRMQNFWKNIRFQNAQAMKTAFVAIVGSKKWPVKMKENPEILNRSIPHDISRSRTGIRTAAHFSDEITRPYTSPRALRPQGRESQPDAWLSQI